MVLVDLDPAHEPQLPLPPCLPLVLPVILTYMWLNNLGMMTQSHCYDWTSFDICVELWVSFPPGIQLYLSVDSGQYK